jgi:tetratricopeptide (TPR) repeat protein
LKQALVFACAAVACAHAQPRKIDIKEPMIITAGPPAQVALGDMDDATLFDAGARAFTAGQYEKAALHFDRLIDAFPKSEQLLPALWNSGLAHERLEQYEVSLNQFKAYLAKRDEPDAQFHAAFAEYKLNRYDDAAKRLHALAERSDLPPARKGEALLQEGVCRVEGGQRAEGEKLLRAAAALYEKDDAVDPALPAQAEFWLGEVYRFDFKDIKLDPSVMDEKQLADTLESKAQFLLSAQGHYLRAIRKGDGEWATASGFRIGDLYELFHNELVQAPLPRGLTEEQRGLYQTALREKVRNLVGKAIRIYEQTLATAQRVGAQSSYVSKTEEALDRLKKLLLETN